MDTVPRIAKKRQAAEIEELAHREPTKEELLADIEQAFRDIFAGDPGEDAFEFLAELKGESAQECEEIDSRKRATLKVLDKTRPRS